MLFVNTARAHGENFHQRPGFSAENRKNRARYFNGIIAHGASTPIGVCMCVCVSAYVGGGSRGVARREDNGIEFGSCRGTLCLSGSSPSAPVMKSCVNTQAKSEGRQSMERHLTSHHDESGSGSKKNELGSAKQTVFSLLYGQVLRAFPGPSPLGKRFDWERRLNWIAPCAVRRRQYSSGTR